MGTIPGRVLIMLAHRRVFKLVLTKDLILCVGTKLQVGELIGCDTVGVLSQRVVDTATPCTIPASESVLIFLRLSFCHIWHN